MINKLSCISNESLLNSPPSISMFSQAIWWSRISMWSLTDVERVPFTYFLVFNQTPWSSKTLNFRSNHWRCSVRNGVLRNFAKFTGKHLCHSLFFNKVAGLTFLQKIVKSSHPEVFLRKGVLKICSKFKGEHSSRSVISIKLRSNFIKIALRHWCPTVNLLHIFRTSFPKNTSGGLLLTIFCENLRLATLLKKRLWHRCFPVNSAKFLGTPFLQNTTSETVSLS